MSRVYYVVICFTCFILAWSGYAQSVASASTHQIMVGYQDDRWFTGYQMEQRSRTRIGFFGYQDDYLVGQFHSSLSEMELKGFVELGRQVFVGNVKYEVGVVAGNITRRGVFQRLRSTTDFLDIAKSRSLSESAGLFHLYGESILLSGNRRYGAYTKASLINDSYYAVAPFYELEYQGLWQISIGFGSKPVYGQLIYETDIGLNLQGLVGLRYNAANEIYYNWGLTYNQILAFTGYHFSNQSAYELGLLADPVSIGISFDSQQITGVIRYRF